MRRLLWVFVVATGLVLSFPITSASSDSFGKLTIHAVDQGGSPIPDLRVRVIDATDEWHTLARVFTYSDGTITIYILPGTYKVAFAGLDWHDLYLEEWWDNASGFDDADVITVTTSSDIHLEAQLQLGGFISGTITDSITGAPLRAVPMLWADDLSWGTGSSDWRTDDNGYYQIGGIPTGTYHVSVNPYSNGYVEMWYEERLAESEADPIPVVAGAFTTGIDFAMVVGGVIEGTVYSEATGLPLRDMTIRAINQGTGRNYEFGLTDSDGWWRIEGLPPETYKVKIEPWDRVHLVEWVEDADSEDDATPVPVVLGETVTGIDAYLSSDHFHDDGGSMFHVDIEWLANSGITKGCNPPMNDRFCPDDPVTRGQMAAFLVRALHLTERLDDPFIDDDDSIFESDIERLAAAGITKGCNPSEGTTKFCPNNRVTRGQMAAFLVRAMGYTDDGGGDLFIDDDDSIFESDIDRLGTAGVTKGCNPAEGTTKFCPNNRVTRGQMAAFLHRALG